MYVYWYKYIECLYMDKSFTYRHSFRHTNTFEIFFTTKQKIKILNFSLIRMQMKENRKKKKRNKTSKNSKRRAIQDALAEIWIEF